MNCAWYQYGKAPSIMGDKFTWHLCEALWKGETLFRRRLGHAANYNQNNKSTVPSEDLHGT
eukprot:scaffold411566_cov15-Prasinocladus_malaysianus.AAC.1